MSKSSLEAAAEAAAKVNAMLIAKGKLKLLPSQIKPKVGSNLQGRLKVTDLITAEVDINDAPLAARNLLTRGHMQDEICKLSGAATSTRGRHMTPEQRQSIATPECRPLYLNVQASSHDAVKIAVRRIQQIIDHHVQTSGVPKSSTVGTVTYPTPSSNGSFGNSPMTTSHLPAGTHFVQDKVFVGLEQAPAEYPVREKILGPGGSFLHHIRTETGATVILRGKGSGFVEPTSGREAFEPLYIYITHPKPEGLEAAKALAVNLIETAHLELAQWQQAQQTILQPLTSIVLPQAAYQNPVLMTPAVLPVNPNTLSASNSVVATGLQVPASIPAGTPISNLMHATVSTLVAPVSVVSSVPTVSVHGVPSPTVITYPTYVANTNQVIARSVNTVVAARPAVPISIVGMLPSIPAATTYTATQLQAPFSPQHPYTQTIGYSSVPAPQSSVSPTSMVMTFSTANNDVVCRKSPTASGAEIEKSPCLQESHSNHPTELKSRRRASKRAAGDKELMPPPPASSVASTVACQASETFENQEPDRKKLKGALGGLASTYGSDDSDENNED